MGGPQRARAFSGLKDWSGAKRVVEGSLFPHSKEDRIKRLEELSGMDYGKIYFF